MLNINTQLHAVAVPLLHGQLAHLHAGMFCSKTAIPRCLASIKSGIAYAHTFHISDLSLACCIHIKSPACVTST